MFFLSSADTRTRHLAAGVLGIMIRDDFTPSDQADIPEGLNPLWIASRVWSLSDKRTGFPVIFDTVAGIMSLGYIRRSASQTRGMFGFRKSVRTDVVEWIRQNRPGDEFQSPLPEPLFQFVRYVVPLPRDQRELALRTTGVLASVVDTIRIAMVEASPFSEHGIAMMSRIDGPQDQFSGAGALAAKLPPEVCMAMSAWRYELEQSFERRGAFRLDPVHAGMSTAAVRRVAAEYDIASILARANAPFEPSVSLRQDQNRSLLADAAQFRNIASRVTAGLAADRRALAIQNTGLDLGGSGPVG